MSQHNIFDSEKLSQIFHVFLTGFKPWVLGSRVRRSTSWATPSHPHKKRKKKERFIWSLGLSVVRFLCCEAAISISNKTSSWVALSLSVHLHQTGGPMWPVLTEGVVGRCYHCPDMGAIRNYTRFIVTWYLIQACILQDQKAVVDRSRTVRWRTQRLSLTSLPVARIGPRYNTIQYNTIQYNTIQ